MKYSDSDYRKQKVGTSIHSDYPKLQRQNSLSTTPTAPLPYITAQSWVLMDGKTSSVIHSKKATLRRECASLTKMMTLYTTVKLMERYGLLPKETFVEVSRIGSRIIGTSACLKEGDCLSVWELYFGMMLPSGNDAAYTLADYFG